MNKAIMALISLVALAGLVLGGLAYVEAGRASRGESLIAEPDSPVDPSRVDVQQPDSSADTAESEQAEAIETLEGRLAQLGFDFRHLREEVDFLREQDLVVRSRLAALLAALLAAAESGISGHSPARFTDSIRYPNRPPIEFEMVLVPGDDQQGIEPFYMATTEVTWEMIIGWVNWLDTTQEQAAKETRLGLRPSESYLHFSRLGNTEASFDKQPAMSMTYLTAEAYCLWLSRQTGRAYRLPSETEWRHALELGGGKPGNLEDVMRQARLYENALLTTENDPFFDPEDLNDPARGDEYAHPAPVGSLEPNTLGIYDMLGNVAEWVLKDGRETKWVVGGHYLLPAAELSTDWRATEDFSVWSATYPQNPVSRYWYADFMYTGIRLVCEPVNIPEAE